MNTRKQDKYATAGTPPEVVLCAAGETDESISGGDSFAELCFPADRERLTRILALMRTQNERNRLPDKLGVWASFVPLMALPLMLLWVFVFMNVTAIVRTWFVLMLCAGLPPLFLLLARKRFGLASWLHRFRDPMLGFGKDSLSLSLVYSTPGRTKKCRWVMPYASIARMEYDRGAKALRIFGIFDIEHCRLPSWAFLPGGMREPPQTTTQAKQWIELPMVFSRPVQILEELERRTGKYISPAMRGDDVADLRDLPGLGRERDHFRGLCVSLLLFSFFALLCVVGLRNHFANQPYRPYPPTAAEDLLKTHSLGDVVTLDGCDIELREFSRVAARDGAVCYQLLLVFTNHNEEALRMRVGQTLRDSRSNISAVALRNGTEEALSFTGAPAGYTGFEQPCPERIESGLHVYATLFLWIEGTPDSVTLSVNSDYWPPRDFLRDVTYKGESLNVEGQTVKSNEIRFLLPASLFSS